MPLGDVLSVTHMMTSSTEWPTSITSNIIIIIIVIVIVIIIKSNSSNSGSDEDSKICCSMLLVMIRNCCQVQTLYSAAQRSLVTWETRYLTTNCSAVRISIRPRRFGFHVVSFTDCFTKWDDGWKDSQWPPRFYVIITSNRNKPKFLMRPQISTD